MADEATDIKADLMASVRLRYKSEVVISRYSTYIDQLSERGVPLLLSFDHLADVTGIGKPKLHSMAFASHLFYRTFFVKKRSGGEREINAPTPALAELQRWIAAKILKPGFPKIADCVSAYVAGRSIVTHVTPHLLSAQLLKIDVKDFFPSISTRTVFGIFEQLGYTNSVSRTLAAVTTMNGKLPQGSPTSPILSNLAMVAVDIAILDLCEQKGLHYSRYADDLVLSGQSVDGVEDEVSKILENFGFYLNPKKTKAYRNPQDARIVTGLLLCDGSVRLPKRSRRRIRLQAHIFAKVLRGEINGHVAENLPNQAVHANDCINDLLFADRILGRLQFWSWIEKDHTFPRQAIENIRALLAKFDVLTTDEVPDYHAQLRSRGESPGA